jgi:hypothetical protein
LVPGLPWWRLPRMCVVGNEPQQGRSIARPEAYPVLLRDGRILVAL